MGFNYTRSSGVAQATLNSETVFRQPAFAVNLDFSATLTKQQDETEPDNRANLRSLVRALSRAALATSLVPLAWKRTRAWGWCCAHRSAVSSGCAS